HECELRADFFGVFLMDPFKPELQEMTQTPYLPPKLDHIKKLDHTLSAVDGQGNRDEETLLQIVILGEKNASGERFEQLARNAVEMGREFYLAFKMQRQQAMQKDVPPQVSKKLFKVMAKILKKDGVTVSREGNNVILTLNKPDDL